MAVKRRKSPAAKSEAVVPADLLAHLPGMLYRCRTDPAWTLEYVAGAVLALTGFTAEELIKLPPSGRSVEAIHPDDRAQVVAAVDKAMADGTRYTVEYRLRTRSGVEKWVWERGSAVTGPDGQVVAIQGFIQDVSSRRRIEQDLRESEHLRRLIIDTEPECVKVVGLDGRLEQMNPAGLRMLEADTLEHANRQPLLEFIVPEHRQAFGELHRRVLAGEDGKLQFEVVGLRGGRRWLETHAVPLRDDVGRVTALLGVTRDITEARQQQQRILRLSRTRSVMSGISALIVRVRDRTELFQEACRVAVEQGGFGLAWVGIVSGGAEIIPVARHGEDHGHLTGMRMSLDEPDPAACGPTVLAVRGGQRRVCNDVAADPSLGPWQEPLRKLGYGSFVAYPLLVGGQVMGCFNLYALEAGFFDEEELRLLGELANDLSFALEFIIQDEKLDYLSIFDPLTRLPNRALFISRLPGFINAARSDRRRLVLLVLDLEQFKSVNDSIGQAGGDELLKHVGERIKLHAGRSGFVARLGGDRFAVLLTGLGADVDVDAEIRNGDWNRLTVPFVYGDQEFQMSCKLGLAVFPDDAADTEQLLRDAELALKRGKASGQTQTRYTAEIGEVASRRGLFTQKLRLAIDRDELRLHYQAKVDLRSGQVCGAEALLRWESPDHGMVLPSEFIPLLEETGMILEVGRWVQQQALRDRAAWQSQGLRVPRISVNVSYVELREKEYVNWVRASVADSPAVAAGIELEVTESTMMADPDANIATLRTLRELGLTVAMDDFGTGYSSLAYLARLPLNVVKIDRSFIIGMADNADTMNIVSSIVTLAHSMNLRVVAEGVDAPEQLQLLRALRCDEIQGYLFSKPLPAAEFAALLKSGRRLS